MTLPSWEEINKSIATLPDWKVIEEDYDKGLYKKPIGGSFNIRPYSFEEDKFQKAYREMAIKQRLSLDPDDPKHQYDWRALYKEKKELVPDTEGHFPSKYKKPGHKRRVVEGIDTVTGEPVIPPPETEEGFPVEPQSKPFPELEEMKVQENNINAMSKTYSELGLSLDTDYKRYEELEKQLDEIELSMAEAPPEMQFSLNQKRSGVAVQYNALVDKLKEGTKRHQTLYENLDRESKSFNMNVASYNKYMETQVQEDIPAYIPESSLKDNIDAFRLCASGIWHNTRQYFNAALPNLIYADVRPEDQKYYKIQGQPVGLSEDQVEKVNEVNKKRLEIYKEKYTKAEANYDEWLVDHPELVPRPEWSEGVIESVKKDPKILLDPAYWGYCAMQTAAFSLGILGTAAAVTGATGNPLLGLGAGVAAAYPFQAQDLWQELVDNGATEAQASKLAVPIGAVIAAVEVMGDLPLLAAVSRPFKKLLTRSITKTVGKKVAKSLVKTGAKTFFAIEGAEILEEVVQGAIQDATVKTFNENVDLLEKVPETIVHTAIATTPFALVGMGGATRMNIADRLKQKIADSNVKALEETLKKEMPEIQKPGDKFTGVAYRAESGLMVKGKTAQEIVDFEAKELGNVDIKEKAEEIAEKMKIKLSEIAEKDVVWVTDTLEGAEVYGEVEKVEISEDNIILAEDGQGGYLIVKNAEKYKKVEPKPEIPTEEEHWNPLELTDDIAENPENIKNYTNEQIAKALEEMERSPKIYGYRYKYTIKGIDYNSVLETLRTTKAKPPVPKVGPQEPGAIYTGKAFRAETVIPEHGAEAIAKMKTAQEKLDYDYGTTGNYIFKEASKIAEDLGIELGKVPIEELIWVAPEIKTAEKYDGAEEIKLTEDTVILAKDEEGGFLVLKNVDKYKVEPKAPVVPEGLDPAIEAWNKNQIYIDTKGNYRWNSNVELPEGVKGGQIAPFSKIIKQNFENVSDFDKLARELKVEPKPITEIEIEGKEEKVKVEPTVKKEIPRTAVSEPETLKALKDEAVRLGKPSWEKLSRGEITTLLDKVRAFKDPGGEKLLKKVGVPTITVFKDEKFATIGVLAGEKVHKVTDSHWMFIDEKVADEVIAEQKKKMFEKLIKEYMKSFPDASRVLAEEYATNQFKEWTEGKEAAVFPEFKGVLETAEKARTKDKTYIQGHVTGLGKDNITILSNGKIQVQISSDYLNMMNKWLPDAEIQLGKIPTDMISFVDKNNKIQAVLMPIRYESEADIPFNVWDIPGGVKPKAIAKEPYQMTKEEYAEYIKTPEGDKATIIEVSMPGVPKPMKRNAPHKHWVVEAVKQNKYIPGNVLEEYPGIREEVEEEEALERPGEEQEEVLPGMEEPLTEEEQELSAREWGQVMEKEAATKDTINKTNIMTWADKAFGFPIKGKATHKWKSAGVFYHKKQIIRMAKWGELAVAAHEIAHGIDLQIQKKLFNKWRWGKLKGITGEFTKELADLDYDQNQRRTAEGFAEYMRYELTMGIGKEKAPGFDKYFKESILPQFPEIKKNLDIFRAKLDIWNKQGAENRIIQHIDWKGEQTETRGFLPKLRKALEWINIRFNDEFYLPQKITAGIEKVIGKKIRPSKNPAILMEYSKAKSGAIARTFVMDKAIDEHGNVVGDSLSDILKPIPNKLIKQFIAFSVSARALNLSARGIESGFDKDDAKFIFDKYKKEYPEWILTADQVTKWSNHMLDWIVRAGGLSKEASELMRELNPIYMPFKRAFLEEVQVMKGVGGYVDTGKAVKAIKGSGRPIINPLESLITQTRELIAKSQKIRIAKAFIDLAEEQGVGGFITRVPAPMKATTFSANQIRDYLDELVAKVEGAEGMTAVHGGKYDDLLTVFTQDFKYSGKENIVTIWRDGKQGFYEIHPDLYEAFKGVDPLKLGAIGKVFAPYARMLRLGATGCKLSFGLARNPFRDAFSYVVFSKRNNTTIFDPIKGFYKDVFTKPGEATWRFKKLGGGLSGQIGLDRASVQNSYDEMLDIKLGKLGRALHIIKHPINTLSDIVSITEMGPRSAEIEASYKKYTSEKWQKDHPDWTEEDAFIQAFCDAQDVTVNFTKSGKWAKQINQVTAFFNVSIRGPEKLYRSIKERPIQTFIKGTIWLTTIAVASWYRNKDKDWYKNLPPAYKYNNLFYEMDGNVYRLPIPFELGIVFMSAPQAALDTMKDQDSKSLEGLLDLAKAQIPNPMPSVFQPAYNVARNKNYLGVPIESEGMQYLYPTERKRDYTTKTAIALSKGMDKIGIQLSPIQLDYMLDSYSGGFIRQFRITGEELVDLPVIGDLMLRDPSYPKRQLNEYFSDWETLRQRKQSGIASRAEIRELNRIDGFYKTYKTLQGNITKAKKANNQVLVDRYSNLMSERLERYGYK